MKPILYTIAKDTNANFVKAALANKSEDYFCLVCNNQVLLRKSGKTGKNSKRPHFAHKTLTPNCTPETALHFGFKNLLAKKIQYSIENGLPLNFKWKCNYCVEIHTGNLLKKISSVVIEHNLKVCQPDIALFDKENKVFAVIEIVVTHRPEENVLKYYNDNNIILIQINLKSDQDLEDLENKVSNPDFVTTCYNPKCTKCGHFQQKTIMTIVEGSCWKCDSIMKAAIIEGGMERGGTSVGPDEFTIHEVEYAQSKGVIIKEHNSKTAGRKYYANTCPSCETFVGDHFLFTEYLAPSNYGILACESIHIGYNCRYCAEQQFFQDDKL